MVTLKTMRKRYYIDYGLHTACGYELLPNVSLLLTRPAVFHNAIWTLGLKVSLLRWRFIIELSSEYAA